MDYSAILMPVICEILDNGQLMTCFETDELIKWLKKIHINYY